jgi:hypothetical protein
LFRNNTFIMHFRGNQPGIAFRMRIRWLYSAACTPGWPVEIRRLTWREFSGAASRTRKASAQPVRGDLHNSL